MRDRRQAKYIAQNVTIELSISYFIISSKQTN